MRLGLENGQHRCEATRREKGDLWGDGGLNFDNAPVCYLIMPHSACKGISVSVRLILLEKEWWARCLWWTIWKSSESGTYFSLAYVVYNWLVPTSLNFTTINRKRQKGLTTGHFRLLDYELTTASNAISKIQNLSRWVNESGSIIFQFSICPRGVWLRLA